MNNIYVSNVINPAMRLFLEQLGYEIRTVADSPYLPNGISSHPDLFICKMGVRPDSPIYFGNTDIPKSPYPGDVPYNAACTGKYFIHNLAATDARLLQSAKEMNLLFIDVRQGYTKCNTIIVNEDSLITADKGIYETLSDYPDLDCLLVQPGYVNLLGYKTGFIGGATGRVGDQIIFHGNLKTHPDFYQITQFIKSKELEAFWFEEFPLTDIGSIIESNR